VAMFISWYVDRICNSHKKINSNILRVRTVKPEWWLAWIFDNHIRLRRRKQKIIPKYRGKAQSYCGKHPKLRSALTVSYGEKLELFTHAQNPRNFCRRRSLLLQRSHYSHVCVRRRSVCGQQP
jgi:hypothetical protein